MKQYLAGLLWDFCECFGISLGNLAPHVFGAMMGCTDYREKKGSDDGGEP